MSSSPFRTFFLGLSLLIGLGNSRLLADVREIATVVTSAGTMEFELLRNISPINVANFKYLADSRYYDGTKFHRLDPTFMVQGGDPLTRDITKIGLYGQGGPEYRMVDELTAKTVTRSDEGAHVWGLLSLANSGKNTNGSQFFVVFGNALHLNGVHTPLGWIRASDNASNETLLRLQATAVTGETPNVYPTLQSVRIRSEIVSDTLSATYPASSVEGLLRDLERNILGAYKVSLGTRGTLSGQLQCYNRTLSFSGRLLPVAGSTTESEFVTHLDTKAVTPIRVRIRVRRDSATGGSASVLVNKLDGTDATLSNRIENAASALMAARDLAGPALGEQYTLSMNAPSVVSGTLGGCGYLTFKYLSKSRLCIALGRLADGVAVVFSFSPSTEGGRDVLPVFSLRFLAGAPSFKFRGSIQVVQNQASFGSLQWYRAAQTVPVVTGTFDTTLGAVISKWTAPSTGQILGPFSATQGIGLIQVGTSPENAFQLGTTPINAFQIAVNNSATTPKGIIRIGSNYYSGFDSEGISMRFIPQDGTFVGTYLDQSLGTKFRREFRGVCVQSGSASQIWGYSFRNGTSLPVVMIPYAQ
jgi:peptidyl-prolyl cis-trans isomerase B (cyclophilin B)